MVTNNNKHVRLMKDVAPSEIGNSDKIYQPKEGYYHTTVGMNRKVSFKETPQADLTEMKSYTPSPLKMDDETWSIGSDIDNPQPIQFLESSDTAISSEMQYQKTSLSESKTDTLYLEKDEDEGDIDDDKDQDFDWNDNPDAEKTMNSLSRRTTVKRIKTAYHKYFCWHYLSNFMKCLVIALVGSSIFITIGVCVYIYFPRPTAAELADPSFTNVRANLQVWMYWAAFMWHLAWLTTFIIEALPYIVIQWVNVFIGHRSEKVKTYLEYYRDLKKYTGLAVILAFNWGTWAFFMDIVFPEVQKQPYTTTIWRIFACLFVASVFLLVQKTVVQVIATRFHRFAFEDRIKDIHKANKVLDALGKAELRGLRPAAAARMRNRKSRTAFQNVSRQSTATDIMDSGNSTSLASSLATNDSIIPLRDQSPQGCSSADVLYSVKKNLKKIVLNEKPYAKRHFREDLDISSDEHAKKRAKKLYLSLAYPTGLVPTDKEERRCLLLSDFEPYFKSAKDTKTAFEIFDRDGNGDINRREFRDTVVYIYRERKDISVSMRDTSQALGKVDYMLLAVTLLALLFTAFAIFNVDIWRSLVPLGSILLGLTFVFGNTAKNTFESVLFLFVTHPYDAGDYVMLDGQYLLVHNLGVMGTTFISGDGQTVYAPTTVLMTKLITNVRRSGSMGETVTINVDFCTTSDQFWELHDRMSAWVASQSRDFGHGFDIRVANIIDVNQLILNIWLPHKGNWQELGKRHKRKTRFMLALKDVMTELNIRYELPAQRFTQSAANNGYGGQEPPLFGTVNSVGHAQHLGVTPQSFATQTTFVPTVPSDPKEAELLKTIRRKRTQRGGHDHVNYSASGPAGDGE